MRITNGIMINNSLNNISKNKALSDKLNTQLATTKKIQRPSEDPIVAIRALRLRSTYNEIKQYLDKNIPDARSWMETTQEAIESINSVLTDITYYCNQGVDGYNTVDERNTLVTTLKQLRDQIYSDGDANLVDRTIFTGYKTDSNLTFGEDEPDTSYSITQEFTSDNVKNTNRIVGLTIDNIRDVHGANIYNNQQHVVNLGYKNIDSIDSITIGDQTYSLAAGNLREMSVSNASAYMSVPQGSIVYIKETGELLLGKNAFDSITTGATMTVDYNKTGFEKGELRPEHYFSCTNETKGIDYTQTDQPINYTINFGQTITINTQAQNVLPHDIARDLDEIIQSVVTALDVQTKIDALNKRLETEGDENAIRQINSMIEVLNLEMSYAESNMKDTFSHGITTYKNHQERLSIELSDIGARLIRLTLNEERLTTQKLNVEDLKSKNEEIEEEEVAVEWAAAQAVYDASLATSAKVVQKSLLDFL